MRAGDRIRAAVQLLVVCAAVGFGLWLVVQFAVWLLGVVLVVSFLWVLHHESPGEPHRWRR